MEKKPDVERIEAADLEYYRKVNFTFEQAKAIFMHMSQHLVAKYQIGPDDAINEDGTIKRGGQRAG